MTPPFDSSMDRKVTKWQLREIWNDPQFQRVMNLRCTESAFSTDRLAPPEAEQEPGTLSQVYDLFDNSQGEHLLLGTFHRYRKPDGTLGASGMADPIYLLVDGIPHYDP
jgi:hypothetical protein